MTLKHNVTIFSIAPTFQILTDSPEQDKKHPQQQRTMSMFLLVSNLFGNTSLNLAYNATIRL